MFNKRGQITAFIIVGLVILLVIGMGLLFVRQTKETTKGELELAERAKGTEKSVYQYIEQCLQEQLKGTVNIVSLQGGYATPPPYTLITEFSLKGGRVLVPYYLYEENSTIPSLQQIEAEIMTLLAERINLCTDFSLFSNALEKRGEIGEIVVSSIALTEEQVKATVQFPFTLKAGDAEQSLDTFIIEISSSLYDLYSLAKSISEEQKRFGSRQCLSCLDNELNQRNNKPITIDILNMETDENIIFLYTLTSKTSNTEDKEETFLFAHKIQIQEESLDLYLPPIEDKEIIIGYPFEFQVKAYGNDLHYYDSSDLFTIDESTGTIAFTPLENDVGSEIVTISVVDDMGKRVDKSFTLTIQDTLKSEAAIDPIPLLIAKQGVLFTHTITLSEAGNYYFSDDNVIFNIDPITGTISFTPKEEDKGQHEFVVTAIDQRGKKYTQQGTMVVIA